jgi:phenylalanyl-tRNA synthetase alpha chain
VREIGGDLIEQVELVDQFVNKKKNLTSHCYRIVYRSMERTLTQAEVNDMHKQIGIRAVEKLNVKLR